MIDRFLQGGTLTQIVGTAGALATLFGVLTVVLVLIHARSAALKAFALLCLLFGDIAIGAGVADSWMGRRRVDTAAANLSPAKAERAHYEGNIQAGSSSGIALPFVGIALALAAIGLQVAGRRRWSEEHDSPPLGAALPGLLFLGGFALSAAAGYFWRGHLLDRPMDESAWRVLELRDAIAANDWPACFSDTPAIRVDSPAQEMREFRKVQDDCAKHFVEETSQRGSVRTDLEKLLAVPWFQKPDDRRNVEQRLDEIVAEEKKIAKVNAAEAEKPKPPPPDPALVKVHDLAIACYSKGARKNAKHMMPSSLQLVVSKDGKISSSKALDAPSANASASKCVAKALREVTFQSGLERTIDVGLSP
jgi:hypothetical protein